MAITADTLTQLAGHSYGPVTFSSSDGVYAATMDGRAAELALDAGTVRVRHTVQVPWPRHGRTQDVERQVGAALALAAAIRPELVTILPDRQSASAVISLWVDAEASDIPDLAMAVRSCLLLGDVSWRAVDQVAMMLSAEEEILRQAAESQARLDEAQQALDRLGPLPPGSGPEPVVTPPPAPEAAVEASAPAPATAEPGSRYCPACGVANAPGYRFCTGCGQPLQ